MSTISSQLLVTSSSLTEDFYKLIRGEEAAKNIKRVFISRSIICSYYSNYIYYNHGLRMILYNLVGNAWAGFGAAFGPLVLLSLYWKGLSRTGAISGMISGSVVVIIWIVFVKPLGEYNDF